MPEQRVTVTLIDCMNNAFVASCACPSDDFAIARVSPVHAMPNSNEKYDLEIEALSQFSDALTDLWGEPRFVFRELRQPPEPDALCTLDGQPLHVEVGHLYGTASDAKELLGRQGKSAATSEEKRLSSLVPLDIRLLTPLNRLLADKATKSYHAPRVWLLIRSALPLWDFDDFTAHLAEIEIPPAHPFEQIWLLCGPQVSFGVLRLD